MQCSSGPLCHTMLLAEGPSPKSVALRDREGTRIGLITSDEAKMELKD